MAGPAGRAIAAGILLAAGLAAIPSAQVRFDDVVRDLRNPEPRTRLEAVRLLREAKYPEAMVPLAPLVNDPVDAVQLEAIAAELSFFLVQDVRPRRRIGGVIEVRNRSVAAAAFELGPLGVWPRHAPRELLAELLEAVDDENSKVRLEAIYTLGTIARPPASPDVEQQLVRALDHYDPAIRAAAARVAGRLAAKGTFDVLMKAVNDSRDDVRFAALRSVGMLRDDRAVKALTDQFQFYGRGEGAWAALDGLARIAHSSSIPLFAARLADRDPYLRRAAAEGLGRTGDTSQTAALEAGASTDASTMVRAAMQFALQKLGRNYIPRLVESLDDGATALQVQEYLIELGPAIERDLLPSLQEPDPAIRAAVADLLGEIGGDESLTMLRGLQDRDKDVSGAAARAVERIRLRRVL